MTKEEKLGSKKETNFFNRLQAQTKFRANRKIFSNNS
jgi:hypothetical protein